MASFLSSLTLLALSFVFSFVVKRSKEVLPLCIESASALIMPENACLLSVVFFQALDAVEALHPTSLVASVLSSLLAFLLSFVNFRKRYYCLVYEVHLINYA